MAPQPDPGRRRVLRLLGLGAVVAGGGGALAYLNRPRGGSDEARTARRARPTSTTRSTGEGSTTTTTSEAPPASTTSTAAAEPTTTTEPAPEPAQTAPVGTAALLCRSAWGAAAAEPSEARHAIAGIMVHHTAVVLTDNRDAPGRVRSHQRFHQRQGFSDIAYHVVVDARGNVYEGRDPATPGETFTDYDPQGWFLVACEGNFDEQGLPAAQRESLVRTLAWAARRFRVDAAEVRAHRDVSATSCPGGAVYAAFSDGSLVRDVRASMAGGDGLEPLCGPGGDQRVRDIEAGQA